MVLSVILGCVFSCLCEPIVAAAQSFLGQLASSALDRLRNRITALFQFETAVEVPLDVIPVVGREQTLLRIKELLRDDTSPIIGLCGMGGIGKTTILKKLNNDFARKGKHGFEVIIFVTVTSRPEVSEIQQNIGDRLMLTLPAGNHQTTSRVHMLHRNLAEKKFLLLLDDLWEKLDLGSVGIPNPRSSRKGAKVVFATRSKQVCIAMDTCYQRTDGTVDVALFDEEESWSLFCSHLHRVPLDNPVIKNHVKAVVRKCDGLPLALVQVAKAMSEANKLQEWENVAKTFEGLEEATKDVLPIIEFSINSLTKPKLKDCLLYCALFPEGCSIMIDQLIEYWVGEGFLNGDSGADSGSLSKAHGEGYTIIRTLKQANLLEDGHNKNKHVRMHDIVRETALWLTRKNLDGSERFVVYDGRDEYERISHNEWESAKRVSWMRQQGFQLPSPRSPDCPNLLTLLVAAEPLGRPQQTVPIPLALLKSTRVLRVLDLSRLKIEELPGEVGSLSELRYLNLSWTKITTLPQQLGNLTKLRHLGLWGTVELRHIPPEAIVNLTRLQRLFLYRSGFSVSSAADDSKVLSWEHLKKMETLEEFSADIRNTPSLRGLDDAGWLPKSIKGLRLVGISDLPSTLLSSALQKLKKMEWLSIEDCHKLEELKIVGGVTKLTNLKYLGLARLHKLSSVIVEGEPYEKTHKFPRIDNLEVGGCGSLKDVGWIRQLPLLEKLLLWSCKGMEVVLPNPPPTLVGSSDNSSPIRELRKMALVNLPALKLISRTTLALPSLELLWVQECASLSELPFADRKRDCNKIREFIGSQEWWDSLKWGVNREYAGGATLVGSALADVFRPLPSSTSTRDDDLEINPSCRRMLLSD